MKKVFFFLFFTFFCSAIYTQSVPDSVTGADADNIPKTTYNTDSVYSLITQNISGVKKRKIITDNVINYIKNPEGWDSVVYKFLDDSKKASDDENIFYGYCLISEIKFYYDNSKSRAFLDSANLYVKKSNDLRQLAHYYYMSGIYTYSYDPDNNKHAINDMYKALNYLEQYGKDPSLESRVLSVIASDAMMREDTVSMKNILDKINKLEEILHDDPALILMKNEIQCSYHMIEYEKTKEERLIDSILFYELNIINSYEAKNLRGSVIDANISLIYLYAAEYAAKKKNPDFEFINNCIAKVEELKKTAMDLAMTNIRTSHTYSFVHFVKGEFEEAEKHALHTLLLVNDYREFGYQNMYVDTYDMLSKICEAKGDFKAASGYIELKSKYAIESHHNEVKTIELQFLADKKEAELIELEAQNTFNLRSRLFAIIMCTLLFCATFLLTLLFNAKRKSLANQAHLEKLAAEDANLQLKLKNEQAKKARLEKYEILTDFYLKEMELIGKTKELEQLETEKKELDIQVDTFATKIEEYERSLYILQNDKKGQQIYDIIRPDIEHLIRKHSFTSKGYIRNLDHISDSFINNLKAKYEGDISIQYIKYCICFAIGMEINEVAECFSIEPTSVHGIRYKLKKKFELNINDDLDIFLRQLN